MNCTDCNNETKRNGKDRHGNQRFRCVPCNKTHTEPKTKMLNNMYLPDDKAVTCLQLLVEGMSIRSIERVTGTNRNTILSLLEIVGKKCLWIQENLVKDVKVDFIEADEIWSFVQMKDKTKHHNEIENEKIGSTYTFTAIDPNSKLIAAWHLGRRSEVDACTFLGKLQNAVDQDAGFQISTDAWSGYRLTVPAVLGEQVDYGQIKKYYGIPNPTKVRYSCGDVIGCKKKRISGNPVKKNISTSIVERNNLTMRMSMRRMTRLTNGFSKKWDNLNYSLALHFCHYNFCRPHKSLFGATPAMAANLASEKWTLKDLLTKATHI